jgi:hypothetical protein
MRGGDGGVAEALAGDERGDWIDWVGGRGLIGLGWLSGQWKSSLEPSHWRCSRLSSARFLRDQEPYPSVANVD